ncbi:MAG: maleylpyruvate isomerase family mycothiol-dependent enzyme [Acidimicrobiales bacterium]
MAVVDLNLATDTIERASAVITKACRDHPDVAVPSCPGWSVSDLTTHTAQIQLWAAGLIDGGGPGPLPDAPADLDPTGLAAWADAARSTLVERLTTCDPERPVWTFVGERPARWWARRQANEAAVHAWDATVATGATWQPPAEIATDALEEVLEIFLPRRWGHKPPTWGEGRTVHLHRTDGDGEWLVTVAAEPVVSKGHAKGDLAVRGPITELLVWTLGRTAPGHPQVEVFGDDALAAAWTANVKI